MRFVRPLTALIVGAAFAVTPILAATPAAAADQYLKKGTPIALEGTSGYSGAGDVAISPDGSRAYAFVSGFDEDDTLDVVDLTQDPGTVIDTEDLGGGGLGSTGIVQVSPDGQTVYVLNGNADLHVYAVTANGVSLAGDHNLADIDISAQEWTDMVLSPDGSTLYIPYFAGAYTPPAFNQGMIAIDIADKPGSKDKAFTEGSVGADLNWHPTGVAISPDGSTLISGYGETDDHGVQLVDLTGSGQVTDLAGVNGGLTVVSPDGRFAYATDGNAVSKIDLGADTVTTENVPFNQTENAVEKAAISPDGAYIYLVYGSFNDFGPQLVMLSTDDLSVVATRDYVRGEDDNAASLAVSPAGDTAATVYVSSDTIGGGDVALVPFEQLDYQPPVALSASITADPVSATVSSGDQVALTAVGAGGTAPYTYSWSGPNGFRSDQAVIDLDPATTASAGDYTVTVTDAEDATAKATRSVTVNKATTSTSLTADPASVTVGDTVTLDVSVDVTAGSVDLDGQPVMVTIAKDGETVTTLSPTLSSGAAEADFTPDEAGDYTATATFGGTDEATASSSKDVTVTAAEAPPAEITVTAKASPADAAEGQDVTLSATASGGSGTLSYTWSGPNGFTATGAEVTLASVTTDDAGTYTVTVTDADDNSKTAEVTVTVEAKTPITARASASPADATAGQDVTLSATASGGSGTLTYTWDGPNGYSATGATATISGVTPADAGTYTVTVTDADNGRATADTTVTVSKATSATTVGLDPDTVTVGGDLIVSGTVDPGSHALSVDGETVTVTVTDGSGSTVSTNDATLDTDGTYSATIVAPSTAGDYTVTADYAGDDAVTASTSAPASLTVQEKSAPPAQAHVARGTIDLSGDRSQTVTGSGFTPGEPVTATLHSTPVDLGEQTADGSGNVTFAFTVPADLETGEHSVVLTGTESALTATAEFTVIAGNDSGNGGQTSTGGNAGTGASGSGSDDSGLAATGSEVALLPIAGLVALLFLGGIGTVLVARRRRA